MSNWKQSTLADLLEDARSGFACGDDVPDGIFQFRMNNVTRDGALDFSKQRRIPSAPSRDVDFQLRRGDVLFNATNSPELVGKSAYFDGLDEPAVFSNHFFRLRPKADKLDGRFLARWLTFQYQRGVFAAICRQWVNQAAVGRDTLLHMQFPLPPLPEQRRIAAILDQADELRAKRRCSVDRCARLEVAILGEVLGGASEHSTRWPLVRIREVLSGGPQNGLYKPASAYGSGTPILRIDGFYDGRVADLGALKRVRLDDAERRTWALRSQDIVINRVNSPEYLGKSAIIPTWPETVVFESNMMRIALNRARMLPRYLIAVLQTPSVRDQIRRQAKHAVNQSSINQKDVLGFEVPIPPMRVQQAFVNQVDDAEEVARRGTEALGALDTLSASLQYRAFRGEL